MCAQRVEDEENSPEITAESTVVLSSSITLSRIFFFINIHIKHGFLHHGSRNPHQIRICYVRVLF